MSLRRRTDEPEGAVTRLEGGVRVGSADEGIVQPGGSDEPVGSLEARIGRVAAQKGAARVEDLAVAQVEHDLGLGTRHPHGQHVGLAQHLVEAADDFVPAPARDEGGSERTKKKTKDGRGGGGTSRAAGGVPGDRVGSRPV